VQCEARASLRPRGFCVLKRPEGWDDCQAVSVPVKEVSLKFGTIPLGSQLTTTAGAVGTSFGE
jgi:hypothetical protein